MLLQKETENITANSLQALIGQVGLIIFDEQCREPPDHVTGPQFSDRAPNHIQFLGPQFWTLTTGSPILLCCCL